MGQKYSVTIDVDANIKLVKAAVAEMQKLFDSMDLGSKGTSGISRLFTSLDKELNVLLQKSNTALNGIGDSRLIEKSVGKINGIFKSLEQEFERLGQKSPKDLALGIKGFSGKMSEVAKALDAYAKAVAATRIEAEKLAKAEESASERVNIALKKRNDIIEKLNRSLKLRQQYNDQIEARQLTRAKEGSFALKAALAESEIQKIIGKYDKVRSTKAGFINESDIKKLSPEDLENYKKWAESLKTWREELDRYDSKTNEIKKQAISEGNNYKNLTQALLEQEKVLKSLEENYDKASKAVKEFNQAGKNADSFDKLKESFSKIFGEDSVKNIKNVEDLENVLNKLSLTAGKDLISKIDRLKNSLKSTNPEVEAMGLKAAGVTDEFLRLNRTNEELNHLTYRLKYFFSLAGGFNLMRRAIRSAITTTKELDAVMTLTAVVSQYTVGDMWKTLPRYSKEASKLGTAIKDVYSAQTLYVQQGLDMNSAMDIGIETMKMAKVANIGAEEATNSMTAALRGFNMELTETSAKRVNDVYSKLALNTASNTQEISTAMTKTAALANSANMSFENTAAFLATIIESTREGAETAGTALKTVIARFTEVKKLYSKGELTGTDEEGQEVDVNKISKALRVAGINMNDFFTGTKGLDEIFMELGKHWNSLTTVLQRYIATMAAGSRQQSRFLALMLNYDRTVLLTDMAYNSAGSGQEQFEKTLDSLLAKINLFKDAWDVFIMGIANSDAIKGIIDFGTTVLETFNKIINSISGSNGVVKSLTSLAVGFGAFKIGRGIFGRGGLLTNLFSGNGLTTGKDFGRSFLGGFAITAKLAQQGELGKDLKFYTASKLLENFGFGKGGLIGDTYFNEDLLLNIKLAAIDYKNEKELIDKDIEESLKEIKRLEESNRFKNEENRANRIKQEELKIAEKEALKEKLLEDYEEKLVKQNHLTPQLAREFGEDPSKIKEATVNYRAFASAALAAGTAALMVGSVLLSTGAISEKTGGIIKDVASGFMVLGTATMALQSIGKALSIGALATGPWALAIGGVISAITTAIALFDRFNESAEEKAERIDKSLLDNSSELLELLLNYKLIDSSLESIAGKLDAFEGLIEGTLEWKNATKELNDEIKTLLDNFPNLINAVEYDENGNMKINIEKAAQIKEKQQELITTDELIDIALKQLKLALAREAKSFKDTLDPFAGLAGSKTLLSAVQLATEGGRFRDIPSSALSGILNIYESASSWVEARETVLNSKYKDVYEKYTDILRNTKIIEDINDKFDYQAVLDSIIKYSEQKESLLASQEDLKTSFGKIKTELINKKFEGYGGVFKNYLSSYLDDLILQSYESYTPPKGMTDVEKEEYYKNLYYRAKGYNQINGTWRKSNGEEAEEVKADTAEYFVKVQYAYDLMISFLDSINEFSETLKKLLQGKGTKNEYKLIKANGDWDNLGLGSGLIDSYLNLFKNFENLLTDLNVDNFGENFSANDTGIITSYIQGVWARQGKEIASSRLEEILNLTNELNEELRKIYIELIDAILSNEITNIDAALSYLKSNNIKYSDKLKNWILNILNSSKKNKTYKDWQDSFLEEFSFYSTIKSSKGFFSEEEKEKLKNLGLVTDKDFENGRFTGDTGRLATKYFDNFIDELNNTIDVLEKGVISTKEYEKGIEDLNNKYDSGDFIEYGKKTAIGNFLTGTFDKIPDKYFREIVGEIFKKEIYNPLTNTAFKAEELSTETLRQILSSYYSGDIKDLPLQIANLQNLGKLITSFSYLSSTSLSNIKGFIEKVSETNTVEYTNLLFGDLIKSVGNLEEMHVSSEIISGIFESIASIDDWNEINTIDDLSEKIGNLSSVSEDALVPLNQLLNILFNFYKSASEIKFPTEKEVSEEIGFITLLKSKAKTGEVSYSDEEVKYLLKLLPEMTDLFVRNYESGGYTYTGDNKVLEKAIGGIIGNSSLFKNLEAKYLASTGKLSDEIVETIFGKGTTLENLTDLLQAILDAYKSEAEAAAISKEYFAAVKMQPYAGLDNDLVRGLGASEDILKAAAIQDAISQSFSVEDLQQYAQELMNIEGMAEGMAYAIAYDAMLMNKGFTELLNNFSNLEANLTSLPEDYTLRTIEQVQSIKLLESIIKNLTGITGELNSKIFLTEDVLGLLGKIAKGDTAAIAELSKVLSKNLVNNLADTAKEGSNALKAFKNLSNLLDDFDDSDAKIGDNLNLNIEKAIDGLLQMGAISEDTARLLFEMMGYEPPEFEPIEVPITLTVDEVETLKIEAGGETENLTVTTVLNSGILGGLSGTLTVTSSTENEVEATVLTNKGSKIAEGSHAKRKAGGNNLTKPKGGGGGGGGGKEFKNDFDKYYNQVEDINELIRIRNLLESDYNQLLKAEGSSGADIYENLKKLLDLLEERRKLTADLADKRKQQLFETMQDEEYKDVAKYAKWNDEDLTIEIDWEAINKVKDSEEGNLIKEYVKKLEDFLSKYDELILALEEIEDAVQEIKERGKEEYTSLEDRVRDALIKLIQDKIDELQDVNDSINDTNQKLFDSISETLELQRQERSNAKTEEELTDKEKRLAYLQQDSSNANQVEIAKLLEELADARESYTDTLIDLKISELQRQNDEAQELRAQLIELMQHSLDWQEKNGEFWNQVYDYILKGTDATGDLLTESLLTGLLQAGEGYAGLSQERLMNWLADLQKDVKSAVSYLAMTRLLEDIGTKEGTKVTFTNGNDLVLTGTVDKNGNVVVKNDDGSTTTYKNVFLDYSGAYLTFETNGEYKAAQKPATSSPLLQKSTTSSPLSQEPSSEELDGNGWYKDENYHWHKTKKGNVIDKDSHSWNYATKGWKTCSICGYYKKLHSGGGGCFVGGTKIIMANYIEKNIEDIKVGDWVFAYDEILRIFEPKKVTKSYIHYNTPSIMELMLSNGIVIKMTPGHPILTTTGWKSMDIENSLYEHGVIAKLLNIGDEIIGYGKNVFVKEIIIKDNINNINVYNIEVEDLHTFVASKIVVHNMKALDQFASGGLATHTGPAWLDGTRSNPELVLNSRDTQNFIELKDTLADMRKNGSLSLAGGDSYYEIVVNVDLMSSDYDVDKAIDRIKARLAQDGAYRNVNTLSRLR